mgnify:FL=1
MAAESYDLIVIGGGPAGYTAAIRAAQLDMQVACVEKEKALGGTCLRIGCIPSKALLESSHRYEEARQHLGKHGVKVGDVSLDLKAMMAHKSKTVSTLVGGLDHLYKKNKITRHIGHGRLDGPGRVIVDTQDGEVALSGKHVLIATGSDVATLRGVELDGDRIGSSTDALSYPKVPGELIVIGAGAIGLEMGSVWSRLGAKVTVLEYLDRILPEMDAEIAAETQKILAKQGLEFRLGSRVVGAKVQGKRCVVECDGSEPVKADRVLVAVGRRPYTDSLGLETVGVELDERGRIPVNEHFATAAESVLAVGDCIAGPMLAHKAQEEAVAAVEFLATGYGHINYDAIPSVVYTWPEVASVGRTEEQLKDDGVEYRKGSFPFRANGRALAAHAAEGRVKILADAQTDRLLGVHIVGPQAGDLIAEAAVAIEFGASAEDLGRATHAHPTLAECVKEAALAVDNRAIYI